AAKPSEAAWLAREIQTQHRFALGCRPAEDKCKGDGYLPVRGAASVALDAAGEVVRLCADKVVVEKGQRLQDDSGRRAAGAVSGHHRLVEDGEQRRMIVAPLQQVESAARAA